MRLHESLSIPGLTSLFKPSKLPAPLVHGSRLPVFSNCTAYMYHIHLPRDLRPDQETNPGPTSPRLGIHIRLCPRLSCLASGRVPTGQKVPPGPEPHEPYVLSPLFPLLLLLPTTGVLDSAVSVDAKTFKSSILAFLALLSLSPVMKTLTASTSSDSIWALAACLFVLNALIADYSSPRPEIYTRERCGCRHCLIFGTWGARPFFFFSDCWSSSLTSMLSINAAISASVVLASRLPDDISVFALMLYAVVLFAMFPVLRHRLQVSCYSPFGVSLAG